MADERARVQLRVTGLVQGVYFRANTAGEARSLGLTGWVRNVPDGSVEAVAEGPRVQLEALVAWCRKGPPAARVTNVDAAWQEATGEFAEFRVRY
jgi:acylphosphatase